MKFKAKKISLLGAVVAFASLPILTVSCSSTEAMVKRHDLRSVVNGTNPRVGYKYDQSFSYGKISEEANQNAYISTLVRSTQDSENGVPYLKLELAKGILLTRFNGTQTLFTNDKHENSDGSSSDKASINSQVFKSTLLGTKTIDFIVHDNLSWVNSEGYQVATTDKEKYGNYHKLSAEDFVYGFQRTMMTNNMLRNSPVSSSNPFGGYGQKTSSVSEQDFMSGNLAHSQKAGNILSYDGFRTQSGGYSDYYVFDLYGIKTPQQLLSETNGKANMIGSYSGNITDGKLVDTVKISGQDNRTDISMDVFFNEMIVNASYFSPAPSSYIKEVSSKIDTITDGQTDLKLPSVETNVRKYGIYTYGTKNTNTLFVSPYVVERDNNIQMKLTKNQFYWNDSWVNDKRTIKTITYDYAPQDDKSVFAMSVLNQFKAGRSFEIPLEDLPTKSQNEIFADKDNQYGVRKINSINTNRMNSNIMPVMLPNANKSNEENFYNFNDEFAKRYFGVDNLDMINNGQMTLNHYLKPEAIQFRSLLSASINWYSHSRFVSPMGTSRVWNASVPEDMIIGGLNGAGKTFNDINELDFEPVKMDRSYYFDSISNGLLNKSYVQNKDETPNTDGIIDSNYDVFINATTDLAKIQSLAHSRIKEILIVNSPIQFSIVNESPNVTGNDIIAMNNMKRGLESLSKHIDVQYNPLPDYDKEVRSQINNTKGSWFQEHKYNPSYSTSGSLMTGMSNERFSLQAISYLISEDTNLSKTFPSLASYGAFINDQVKELRKELFAGEFASYSKYFKELSEIANLTNAVETDLSASKLLSETLLNKEEFAKASESEKEVISKIQYQLSSAFMVLDKNYQETHANELISKLFVEFKMVTGSYFGHDQNIAQSQDVKQMKAWNKWLVRPIQNTGYEYMADWRIK